MRRAWVEVRRFLVIESTVTLHPVIVSARSVRLLFYAGQSGAIIFTEHVIRSIGNLMRLLRGAFETDEEITDDYADPLFHDEVYPINDWTFGKDFARSFRKCTERTEMLKAYRDV